ncbi:MAG: hypothetical protein ACRCX2_33820 [Paraclostridium sp.]
MKNICVECFKEVENSDYISAYSRCDRCIDLKHWDCKKCNCPITVVEYDNNKHCNHCTKDDVL